MILLNNKSMLSPIQKFLIKQICVIQNQSLQEVFLNPIIEDDGEELLAQFGATRGDFDKAILTTKSKFELVHENPDLFLSMDYDCLIISLFILNHIRDEYNHKYPNAIRNIYKKIITLININDNLN